MRYSRPMHTRNAFTLIELLLVMVILGVLAAIVVPKFTNRTEDTKKKAAVADISGTSTALEIYEVDNGRYPTTDEGVAALYTQPSSATAWKGPYIGKPLVADPWGNPYVYRSPGVHNPRGFDISSNGPDGQEGGSDDIDNWSVATK